MRITTATTEAGDGPEAVREAARSARAALGDAPCDLALLFCSREHLDGAAPGFDGYGVPGGVPGEEEVDGPTETLLEPLAEELAPRAVAGCAARGVIGGTREYEEAPAVTLWAASLPGAEVEPFGVEPVETPEGLALTGIPPLDGGPTTLILIGDPFTFPAAEFVEAMAEEHPEVQVLGGVASAADEPGGNRLFLGGRALTQGAVGVLLRGVEVRPVVAQGCRPFGRPFVVTRGGERTIRELGGRRALDGLREEAEGLGEDERDLLPRGLHIGRAVDPSQVRGDLGEFLVRNVTDIDEDSGSIEIGDRVRPGQTVRFHLQDPRAASEDLAHRLRDVRRELDGRAAGSLLFACNGRGRRFFGGPDHDPAVVARELGDLPLGGFFAAGELGPVGPRSYLHGFAAVLAIFAPAE